MPIEQTEKEKFPSGRSHENAKLLTVKELSEILAIKPKTLYSWAELQRIPCYKIKGCLRFSLPEVMEWMKSWRVEPTIGYNSEAQALISPRKGGQ
jgi:excisionase family DNA binding protein